MANIELVIKMDEDIYNDIKNGKVYSSTYDVPLESVLAIANGTPLDKIRKRIELEKLGYPPSAGYYKAIAKVSRIIGECQTKSDVQNAVLDKIKSEITELDGMYVIRDNAIYAERIPRYERLWYVRLGEVIDILDKYKAESEDKE